MTKFRGVELVQAVQWLGAMQPITDLLGFGLPTHGEGFSGSLRLNSSFGDMRVGPNDWIIKHDNGKTYALTAEEFTQKFAPVEVTD